MHKFIHHQVQLLSVYSYYFNKNRIFHSYNTRILKSKDALHSQSFRTSFGQRYIKVLSFGTLSLPQLLRVSPAASSLGAPMLMAFLFIDSIHCLQLLDPGKPVSISASPSVTPL